MSWLHVLFSTSCNKSLKGQNACLQTNELDLELHADHYGDEGCAPVVLFLMKSSQLKTLIISGQYALAYLFVGKQGVQLVASGVKVADDS